MNTFDEWVQELERLLTAVHPGASTAALDHSEMLRAWRSGITANQFLQTAAVPQGQMRSSAGAPSSPVPPYTGAHLGYDRKSTWPVAMWVLTGTSMILGLIGAVLWYDSDIGSMKAVLAVALVLDALAVVLAVACLFINGARIHGLCKLGWEIVAGASCFFVTWSVQLDLHRAYNGGFADGTAKGYTEGYRRGQASGYDQGLGTGEANGYNNGASSGFSSGYGSGAASGYNEGYQNGYANGFNSGASEQLARDQAAVRGY